jgi:ergothioneine biosynthesis protein EgtB
MPFVESGTTPPSVPVTSAIHVPPLRRLRPGISSDIRAGFTKPGLAQREKATGESLPDPHLLTAIYEGLRSQTRALTVPLSVEDQAVQSMPDASPTKWHLAHTTWFFETFILARHLPGYDLFDESYTYLFNSYYETVGRRHPRAERGLLTRPSSADITRYRAYVDEHMAIFMAGFLTGERGALKWQQAAPLVLLGCHHEQQHQELLLMDVLHLLSCNPTWPAYTQRTAPLPRAAAVPFRWINYPGGDYGIGHQGTGFAFDNEGPHHKVKLQPFAIASRAVTNGEWLAFMDADGYQRPELWLADGWDIAQRNNWCAPQYWHAEKGGPWRRFTLNGLAPLDLAAPVCHVSYYEADAYARWIGHRLPTEAEWEVAAASNPPYTDISSGNFLETGVLEPQAPVWGEGHAALQMFGDVWEWTQSPYTPYPGFKASSGAVGEYNGKFMVNQMVLRGGSCITPASHIRATYRNFFYPHMRWQFAGLRLASHIVS